MKMLRLICRQCACLLMLCCSEFIQIGATSTEEHIGLDAYIVAWFAARSSRSAKHIKANIFSAVQFVLYFIATPNTTGTRKLQSCEKKVRCGFTVRCKRADTHKKWAKNRTAALSIYRYIEPVWSMEEELCRCNI